ncbi:unnamed protein product [Diatraea saccharalis]|uniref:Peroxidase n=1 Tax=Diatraea saccharalis TaxID=40085 RepID=A0A9N9W786_9NEOP|nr:unnamed protein product [Diatraea saccharalis]
MVLSRILLFSVFLIIVGSEKIRYDSFKGCPISDKEYKETIKRNTTFWCVNEIEPCDPDEGRRVDGSCNNLKHPTRGATHTPFYRILPAEYDTDDGKFEPRKASDGGPLPLARYLRTSFLAEGKVPDPVFTQLLTHILAFVVSDVLSLQDTVNYIVWRPYCCLPKGKTDPNCVPNEVPVDDPVHRFSGIRCFNMTRPESFQSMGCIKNGTVPERIISSTPMMDLSQMYGNLYENLAKNGRKFEKGLLKYEVEDDRIWPPSTKTKVDLCLLNQKPVEKRCHATPEDGSNTLLGINLFSIWFWRNHNRMANALSELNPAWDDEKLFYTARDINIATWTQIVYYELLPLLMGRDNLIRDSVIMSTPGFRDLYNEEKLPQIALEYPLVTRWFHVMQEGALKLYDQDGYYLRDFPIVNLTLRTGWLAVDDNIDYITQGSFRQACGKADYIVDPDMSEVGLGPHQRANDVLTSDLAKNRYFGFKPYVAYREWCFGRSYDDFDDLKEAFDPERLELLKERYKSVEDIDLMAGLWLEKHVEGGYIPETLYCIMSEQLIRFVVSDRHWYERPNRPHAFTADQLLEIRKASVSRLLCDVGDKVSEIQPQGFVRAGPKNKICSCEEIPKIDLSAWKDSGCKNHCHYRNRK